ncbi:MAG: choice-of-anchor tandem repeat NxxGxxAF-containing protein [Planctomycetota bacterium]
MGERRGEIQTGLAALALTVTLAVGASASGFEVVMHAGQEITVPGRPDLPTLRVSRVLPPSAIGFEGGPALNNAGQLALSVTVADVNVTGGQTIGDALFHFDSASSTPTLVALAGDAVPGQPNAGNSAGVTYDQFLGRRLILDSAGRLAFGAQWERPGTFAVDPALHVYTPPTLPGAGVRTVVWDSTTDPVSTPDVDPLNPAFGWVFNGLNGAVVRAYESRFAFNANRLVFGGAVGQSPTQSGANGLYWEAQPGGNGPNQVSALSLIARDGPGSSFNPSPQPAGLNPNGLVAFRTNIDPRPDASQFSALVTFFNDVSIEVQTGSDAGGDISFAGLPPNFGFNNVGQVAFRSGFTDLPNSNGGIFKTLDPDGIIATNGIVANGSPDLGGPQGLGIPDGVPDFVFTNLQSSFAPLLNGAGDVVFEATARTPDGSQTVRGLWSSRTGPLTSLDPIAFIGDPAPGLPEGYTIQSFGVNQSTDQAIGLNAHGDIAVLGQYRADTGQVGVALWAEVDGQLQLVAADDFTQIHMPDGRSFVVQGLGFSGGSGNQDGRPSGWNDNHTIAFRADGSGSINGAMVVANLLDPDFRGLPGDFNGSGQVEQGDLNLVLNNWGTNTVVNGDAVIPVGWKNYAEDTATVDQNELNLVLNNWGSVAAPSFEGFNVPEPGVGFALGLGLGLAGGRRPPVRVLEIVRPADR